MSKKAERSGTSLHNASKIEPNATASKRFQSQKAPQSTQSKGGHEAKEKKHADDAFAEEKRALLADIQNLTDQVKRGQAELANAQRRSHEQMKQVRQYAINDLVERLIPVIDSIEHSIDECQGDDKATATLRKGNVLVLELLLDVLGRFGVRPINPIGERFDPMQHEAMSQRKEKGTKKGTIVEVFRKGYFLHNRIVRPAMVILSLG